MICLAIFAFSCEKEYLVPEDELPDWLLDQIELYEQTIADNPKSSYAWSSWIRYEWNSEYYYEFWNLLSSTFPNPISHARDTLDISQVDADTDYFKEKCCGAYVWKGPNYIGHLE